jgi:hypothetical protein
MSRCKRSDRAEPRVDGVAVSEVADSIRTTLHRELGMDVDDLASVCELCGKNRLPASDESWDEARYCRAGFPTNGCSCVHRIVGKVDLRSGPLPGSNCWLWRGSSFTDGYPAFSESRGAVRGHKSSWLVFKGALPVSMPVLEHACDTRTCVNPRHLMPSTQGDNMRTKARSGRANTARIETRLQDAVHDALRSCDAIMALEDGIANAPFVRLLSGIEELGGTIEIVINGRRLSLRRAT